MFKKIVLGALLFHLALSGIALAGNSPWQNALISDPWSYTGFVYDPKQGAANWYKGELKFYSNNTVDVRTIDSSGNFDPTTVMQLKYRIDNNGKLSITDPTKAYPYLGGQMNKSQDKISTVTTIDNAGPDDKVADLTPGIILLVRKQTASFNNLDLVGQWGGTLFANTGKEGIGWQSFNLTIDARGQLKGTEISYDGNTGSFQGTGSIDASGHITLKIISDHQDKNATPVQVTGQMSKERDILSFEFRSTDPKEVSLGIGSMIKK